MADKKRNHPNEGQGAVADHDSLFDGTEISPVNTTNRRVIIPRLAEPFGGTDGTSAFDAGLRMDEPDDDLDLIVPKLTLSTPDSDEEDDLVLLDRSEQLMRADDADEDADDGLLAFADSEDPLDVGRRSRPDDSDDTPPFEGDFVTGNARPVDDTSDAPWQNALAAARAVTGLDAAPVEDESASDDLVVLDEEAAVLDLRPAATQIFASEPVQTVSGRPMPELPKAGDFSRLTSPGARIQTPPRIGSGRLVPARLTWKPGDPFAEGASSRPTRFRWEVMLTVACGTAVSLIGALWLLRLVTT